MKKINIRKVLNLILSKLSNLLFGKSVEKLRLCFDLTKESRQAVNRLVEKSGVRDISELIILSFSILEKLLDHVLHDGKIYLYEENEVNKEELELLDDIERLREMIKNRKENN